MIISASRRTDIPAFHSEWFMNRIAEGWFESVNPFNPSQVKIVSLLPQDVDVIVFWSKNPEPMLKYLYILNGRGFRYYFQYTLNDYPEIMEPHVPALNMRIETFRKLGGKLGSSRVVWRYDPIIISNVTPVEYHMERFASIARQLSGYCERVVISFLDFYPKVLNRWKRLINETGFEVFDVTLPEFADMLGMLANEIYKCAKSYGMSVYTCSELMDLSVYGINHGSCIDADLINGIFKLNLNVKKDRNQRTGCLCAQSTDIGAYNCCGHGCSYCYANLNESLVKRNMSRHDAANPYLLSMPL